MSTSVDLADRQDVIAVPGYATETTCKVLVVVRHISNSEPSIELTCNGVTYDNSDVAGGALTHYGTDHNTPANLGPMWAGVITVTGLSGFTSYPITIDDVTNGTSNSGTLMTSPGLTDDFAISIGSCFQALNGTQTDTGYKPIFDYSGLPIVAHIHVDDLWYAADTPIVDLITGLQTNGTDDPGGPLNPASSDKEYDWAVAYLAGFGMLGEPTLPAGSSDPVDAYRYQGCRNIERMWVLKNLNQNCQWGDHEIRNDVGWDAILSGEIAEIPATTLWDETFGAIAGVSAQNNDSTARHWYADFGPLRAVSMDCITNSDATVLNAYSIPVTSTYNILGDNQVLDILEALDTTQPFKMLVMPYGLKYPCSVGQAGTDFAEINTGEQHPIKNHSITMYSDLMTKDDAHIPGGQKSIMLNNNTNGVDGITFAVSGDYHNSVVYYNHSVAAGSDLAESITVIDVAPMIQSLFPYDSTMVVGEETDQEATPEFLSGYQNGGGGSKGFSTILEIYGSSSPREAHIKIYEAGAGEVFHKKFIERAGNFLWDSGKNQPKISAHNEGTD